MISISSVKANKKSLAKVKNSVWDFMFSPIMDNCILCSLFHRKYYKENILLGKDQH